MRKTWIAIALWLVSSSFALGDARSLGDAFAGYSVLNGNLLHRASGWNVAVSKNFGADKRRPWFGVRGDVSAFHQSVPLGHNHLHDFMAGPQVLHTSEYFALSAHGLIGLSHTGGALGSHNGFSSALGGAIDWYPNLAIGIRLAQVDYHQTQVLGHTQHSVRFSVGIVFRAVAMVDPPRPAPQPPPPPQPDKTPNSLRR